MPMIHTLVEQQAVWLHQGEHFFDRTSVFSCVGAPILGLDGQCVGMLDLIDIQVAEQPALKHRVMQSARSIKNAMTLSLPHRWLLRLNRPGGDMLGIHPAASGGHGSELFAVEPRELFDADCERASLAPENGCPISRRGRSPALLAP